MKKVIIFLMMAVVWMSSFADEPARISANVGVLAPYTLDATIGYERPVGYGHSLCLFGEAGNRWQTPACHMFWKKYYWDGGVEYKHRLVRYKNGSFRIFGGAYCGAYVREFFFGCQAGLNITTPLPTTGSYLSHRRTILISCMVTRSGTVL